MNTPLVIRLGSTEWVIRREFESGNRGPCYIAEINHKGTRLLDDPSGVATLNDPRFGGLWGFGCIVANPPPDYRTRNFWSWAWDLTTRLSGAETGFGVTSFKIEDPVTNGDSVAVHAEAEMCVKHQPIFELDWRYRFTEQRASCDLKVSIVYDGDDQLYLKEPKITANGLAGFRTLSVRDAHGHPLKPWNFNLANLKNPSRKTQQISDTARSSVELSTFGTRVRLINDRGFDAWYAERNSANSFDSDPANSPIYCLRNGDLKDQWEIVRLGAADRTAVIQHVDEGGSGAPDCWVCFRPLIRGATYSAALECVIS